MSPDECLKKINFDLFDQWTEDDFQLYELFCQRVIATRGRVCRECWHLHCNPNHCTMRDKILAFARALVALDVFPPEIVVMISLKLPAVDKINA